MLRRLQQRDREREIDGVITQPHGLTGQIPLFRGGRRGREALGGGERTPIDEAGAGGRTSGGGDGSGGPASGHVTRHRAG